MLVAEGELRTSGYTEQLPDPAAMGKALEETVYQDRECELHLKAHVLLQQLGMTKIANLAAFRMCIKFARSVYLVHACPNLAK